MYDLWEKTQTNARNLSCFVDCYGGIIIPPKERPRDKKLPSQRAPMPHPFGPMIATGTSTGVASGGLVRCRGTGGGRGQIGSNAGHGGTRHHDLLTPADNGTGITDRFPPVGLSSLSSVNAPAVNGGSESTPNAEKVLLDNSKNGPRSSHAVNESSLTDRQKHGLRKNRTTYLTST